MFVASGSVARRPRTLAGYVVHSVMGGTLLVSQRLHVAGAPYDARRSRARRRSRPAGARRLSLYCTAPPREATPADCVANLQQQTAPLGSGRVSARGGGAFPRVGRTNPRVRRSRTAAGGATNHPTRTGENLLVNVHAHRRARHLEKTCVPLLRVPIRQPVDEAEQDHLRLRRAPAAINRNKRS